MCAISADVMTMDYHAAKEAFERAYLLQLMVLYDGRVSKVAKHAGYEHAANCRTKLKQLGLFPWIMIDVQQMEKRA
jgi:hypothetical protein